MFIIIMIRVQISARYEERRRVSIRMIRYGLSKRFRGVTSEAVMFTK